MSALTVNEHISFNDLKEYLDLTDGNLASHLKALEKEKFIAITKTFVGRKPLTTYYATPEGIAAFGIHLKALENLIHAQK
ncbi:Winged helix DNA-binding domain protein [compost metagenome]